MLEAEILAGSRGVSPVFEWSARGLSVFAVGELRGIGDAVVIFGLKCANAALNSDGMESWKSVFVNFLFIADVITMVGVSLAALRLHDSSQFTM